MSSHQVKAMVLTGSRSISEVALDPPRIGDRDGAVLRIEACGVCGSDVPYYTTGVVDGIDASAQPVIMGHEMVGRIEQIGPVARSRWGVAVGDRVVAERAIPCGHCEQCLTGVYPMCRRPGEANGVYRYGSTPLSVEPGLWGGFADKMYLHPDSTVYPASGQVSPQQLALFTPLSNGLSWTADAARLRRGQSVLIQGPGQQGLACVLGARACGASRILVSGLSSDAVRLEAARALGATDIVIADTVDSARAQVDRITNGRGVTVVIDATSGESTLPVESAVHFVADGGRLVLATGHEGGRLRNFDVDLFWRKRLTMVGVRSRARWAVSAALDLIVSRAGQLSDIPSLDVPLTEVEYALRVMASEIDLGDVPAHVTVTPRS